jgi:hypothetical protein
MSKEGRIGSEIVPVDQRREVVSVDERSHAIVDEVRVVRDMTAAGPSKYARRLLFLWFRVFVLDEKEGRKDQRVNVRIPIPLPLIGLLFPRSVGWQHALAAIAAAREAQRPALVMRDHLDSVMALEFVRVEQEKPGKRQLVVVGLD